MKSKIVLLLLMILVFSYIKVDALCTQSAYNDLKAEAFKAQLTWELKFDEKDNSYFQITVANMSDNLLLNFGGTMYESNEYGSNFTISTPLEGGKNYEFKFYGGYYHSCAEEYVYTKKIDIPKYNKYSQYEECIEFEEWPLCNKWYNGDIESEEYFYEQLEKYKASIKVEEPIVEEKDDKNIFEKFVEFYTENLFITLPITMALILVIIVIVIIKIDRKRKRTKINFDL